MDKIENRKQVAEKLELHSGHGKKGRFKKIHYYHCRSYFYYCLVFVSSGPRE